MGACYSRKAGGGNYTYTTVDMASTKLEDSSRITRPTPYSRSNSSTFSSRKSIPVPTKHEHSPHMGRHVSPDTKSIKNSQAVQSSIPRYSSNTSSTPVKSEMNENIINANIVKNENQIHLINNNNVAVSPSILNSQETSEKIHTKQVNKLNSTNKDLPELVQVKIDEKPSSKIPAKVSYMTSIPCPQMSQIKPHSTASSVLHSETRKFTNLFTGKHSKNSDKYSPTNLDESKISSTDSQGSIADFDSGLGNSFIDKIKPEDSDTLKDVERLESCDISPISVSEKKGVKPSSHEELKVQNCTEKSNLKCPMYKREINGKWIVEEKINAEKQCQLNGENIFKINMASSNSFPTYASYKSHVSYKKYSNNQHQDLSNRSNKIEHTTAKQNNKDAKLEKSQVPAISPKQPSVDSDEKSDGIGSDTKSPISEIENRDFLIDDEISDQPELVCSFINGKVTESPIPSLQQSVTELHALQMSNTSKKGIDIPIKNRRERLNSDNRGSMVLSSELGSSCSSIASDDLMMDFEKKLDFPEGTINEGMASPMRKFSDIQAVEEQLSSLVLSKSKSSKLDFEENTRKRVLRRSSGSHSTAGPLGKDEWRIRSVGLPLRPPRPMSFSEADDGSIILDSSSYRLLSQDLNSVKTLLLRLKSVIQEAETINPFDQNIFYQSLVHSDFPLNAIDNGCNDKNLSTKSADLSIENADLRRQLVLLHQQLEEKDRTIHLLQQQMTKYSNIPQYDSKINPCVNAATQTERSRSLANSLTPSLNNSSETLVSFRISKQRGYF